jgi:hypothetical protein
MRNPFPKAAPGHERPVVGCLLTGSNKRIADYRVVRCSSLRATPSGNPRFDRRTVRSELSSNLVYGGVAGAL